MSEMQGKFGDKFKSMVMVPTSPAQQSSSSGEEDEPTSEKVKNIGYRHSSVPPKEKKNSAMAGLTAIININNQSDGEEFQRMGPTVTGNNYVAECQTINSEISDKEDDLPTRGVPRCQTQQGIRTNKLRSGSNMQWEESRSPIVMESGEYAT